MALRNKRLWAVAAAALVLLCAIAYVGWSPFPEAPPARDLRRTLPGPPGGAALDEARRRIDEAYRLRPDARFLAAVADVDRFLTGREQEEVGAEFRDGLWHISCRGRDVGAVPEFPDFPELLELLEAQARKIAEESGASFPAAAEDRPDVRAELDRFTAPHAISAARTVDALWNEGARDAGLLKLGAEALGLVYLQCFELVEVSDAVAARAFAALALCKALTSESVLREECLLAEAMGYNGHAVRLSGSLGEGDPLRMLLRREYERLEKLAWSAAGTDEARYRNLIRISWEEPESLHVERWRRAADAHFDFGRRPDALLPVLKTSVVLGGFGSTVPTARLMLSVVLAELERGGLPLSASVGTPDASLSATVPRFEPALDKAAAGLRGPFLDREILDGYYRGHFYSALCAMARHYVDMLSSLEATGEFLRELGGPREGPAADFARWLEHVLAAQSGKGSVAHLHGDIRGGVALGGWPLRRTHRAVAPYLGPTDPERLEIAKGLASRLDSRDEHLRRMLDVTYADLLDPAMWERLYRARMKFAGAWALSGQARLARFTGDRERLEELLRRRNVPPRTFTSMLRYMEELGGFDRSRLQTGYEKQIALVPDDWMVTEDYVEYLERIGEYAKAGEVASRWVARHDRRGGARDLCYIDARVALARMCRRAGEYEKGMEAVGPVAGSWKFGAMQECALLLDELGRAGEAMELARAAYERYPDNERAVGLLAELHWRRGRYSGAAEALEGHRHPLALIGWHDEIAPRFVGVFRDRSEEAGEAVEALTAGRLDPFCVANLAYRAAEEGLHALAFSIQSRIREGRARGLQHTLQAYVYLKRWKGRPSALEWLRPRLPADDRTRNAIAVAAHPHGEYDLLWELLPEEPRGANSEGVWLMRAVAAAKAGPGDRPRREAVARFLERDSGELPRLLGRYLLGTADETEVRAAATTSANRLAVAYYMGLKAQIEGRLREAADWYRVAYETGGTNPPEYHWAREQLIAWVKAERSLDLLAAGE